MDLNWKNINSCIETWTAESPAEAAVALKARPGRTVLVVAVLLFHINVTKPEVVFVLCA